LTSAVPFLEKLQKEEGESGRRQIKQYTRILTLILAIFESLSISFSLRPILFNWNIDVCFQITLALTTGSMIVLWLSDLITEDEFAIDLLARIGEPAIPIMKRKMRSNTQSVRFAAGDVLVKMIEYHPEALSNLTSAIDKQGIKTIANNYIFYIRLGQPGTENIILKALRYNFSLTMGLDLLNCGSSIIEEGAAKIGRENGYTVTSGVGTHPGPRWGSSD
jgi:hypothetical protein